MGTKTKSIKHGLRQQLAGLMDAFVQTNTKAKTKKIRKAIKEASKLVAKAIVKELKASDTSKKEKVFSSKKPKKSKHKKKISVKKKISAPSPKHKTETVFPIESSNPAEVTTN
ncbi:MAG: hypothetical protein ACHQHP_01565 [Bacteroidia bacterium]